MWWLLFTWLLASLFAGWAWYRWWRYQKELDLRDEETRGETSQADGR